MHPTDIEILFGNLKRSGLDNYERFRPLLERDFHLMFEQADYYDDDAFFATNRLAHSDFFDMWVFFTRGVFEYDNYMLWKAVFEENKDLVAQCPSSEIVVIREDGKVFRLQ